jgi:phosphoglucosamine mutase
MKRSDKTLAQLLHGVTLFPQKLINVRMQPDADWKGSDTIRRAISKVEQALHGRGRVLIRASGTEPVLRVMVEAEKVDDAVRHAESIADAVKQATA